jgi:hypothetical protein
MLHAQTRVARMRLDYPAKGEAMKRQQVHEAARESPALSRISFTRDGSGPRAT